MSHKPAGGLHSKVVRHTTSPKVEPRSRAINPSAVNYLGNHLGDHVTNKGSTGFRPESLVRGAGYNAPVGPKNLMPEGAGSGRTIYGCGSQGVQGEVNRGSPRPNPRHDATEQE
jgi:hypothetical protein